MDNVEDPISSVASLNEPIRRNLYRYVVEQGGEITRDQAAAALGISRGLAAFHLDRLVEEGLLGTSFRRLSGKQGPGAGRPSKLYRRSDRQVEISLPPRSYELAARLLAEAVAAAESPETLEMLSRVARSFGESLGSEARAQVGSAPTTDELLAAAEQVLSGYGFEPCRQADGAIRLRNCPFHTLAECHRGLVCGMNHSLMQGVVQGLEAQGIAAELDPQPGMCCVAFKPIRLQPRLPS